MGSVSLVGKDIRGLAYGSVVQLNRTVGEPVDLLLDGRSIAQGEIVLINGKNLGVRILALNK
jgi:flagellar motor switch protein FliN/FliY